MSEDIKISSGGQETNENKNGDKINPKEAPLPTDFKIAEIWIRNGQIHLDAGDHFWADRVRALGVMELCKDIIKTAQIKKEESKIIQAKSNGVIDFVRNGLKRKKR